MFEGESGMLWRSCSFVQDCSIGPQRVPREDLFWEMAQGRLILAGMDQWGEGKGDSSCF